MKNLKVGDQIVFNSLPDATVFGVTRITGPFTVGVKQTGRMFSEQFVDKSLCKTPTKQQLVNYSKELAQLAENGV